MYLHEQTLAALDQAGYVVLEALTYGGLAPTPTHARPSTFVCIDGRKYWVKSTAQQGLVAELISGRLGAKVGATPMARIIRVTREALPASGEADHLEGLVVGVEDIPNTINARELQPFLGSGAFQTNVLDPASRARAVAFQTWLGVGDAQVLVSLTDGTVSSIDHGDCFGTVSVLSSPSLVLTSIPGVADDVGKETEHVEAAVNRIEAITVEDIVEAVANIPAGQQWSSPAERRLQIAHWLEYRRDRLREVMEQWLQR